MNGPEHYREAEDLLEMATEELGGSNLERYYLAKAQVHATLAHAAAIALALDGNNYDDWHQVIAPTSTVPPESAPG